MTHRKDIVRALERLAFAAELSGDRRAAGWKSAAWAIRQLDEDLAQMIDEGRLQQLKGVGPATSVLVADLLDGLVPAVVAEMEAAVAPGLFDLRRIKGLGAKKIKALHEQLGVSTLGELEYACRENRLLSLKGFGAKTQQRILEEIARLRADEGKLRRDRAQAVVAPLLEELSRAGVRAQVVGDLPRGCELVEHLGLLVEAGARVEAPPEVEVAYARAEEWGWRALERTAHPAHLAALEACARERGVELAALSAPDEEAVYAALGLLWTPPERREPGVPLVGIGQARTPFIRRVDLRGALHNHSVASDGAHTLRQMRAAAAAVGLRYLGISDHSVSAFYARGLSAEALLAQAAEIEALNAEGSSCVLLTGVESDILPDGRLDYEDAVLARLEVVVASVHGAMRQDEPTMTARMVAAARSPHTAVVGHPTGRLLLGRPPARFDVGRFLDACAESGCAVELNANPARLDLHERHLAMARERGIPISIAADAHAVTELDHLDHGVAIARRAGLTPEDVLNAWELDALRAWLAERRSVSDQR